MSLARAEQHALLRMERSLRRDPVLRAAVEKFSRGCPRGRDPAHECLSPWHPALWRATFIALLTLTVAFIALAAVLAVCARWPPLARRGPGPSASMPADGQRTPGRQSSAEEAATMFRSSRHWGRRRTALGRRAAAALAACIAAARWGPGRCVRCGLPWPAG